MLKLAILSVLSKEEKTPYNHQTFGLQGVFSYLTVKSRSILPDFQFVSTCVVFRTLVLSLLYWNFKSPQARCDQQVAEMGGSAEFDTNKPLMQYHFAESGNDHHFSIPDPEW